MTISLAKIRDCLLKEKLLKEFVIQTNWSLSLPADFENQELTALSYDSRQVDSQTLFFCKGLNF